MRLRAPLVLITNPRVDPQCFPFLFKFLNLPRAAGFKHWTKQRASQLERMANWQKDINSMSLEMPTWLRQNLSENVVACWTSSCCRCMSTLKPDSEWRESSPFSCCSLALSVSLSLFVRANGQCAKLHLLSYRAWLVALSFLLWGRQINDWSVGGQFELHFSRTCPLSAGL